MTEPTTEPDPVTGQTYYNHPTHGPITYNTDLIKADPNRIRHTVDQHLEATLAEELDNTYPPSDPDHYWDIKIDYDPHNPCAIKIEWYLTSQ